MTQAVTTSLLVNIACIVVFGYEYLHHWERYAWIALTVIFCMLYGLGSRAPGGYDISAQKASEDTGRSLAGDVLSFGGIVFGSCSGWAPVGKYLWVAKSFEGILTSLQLPIIT